ncbi:MAG TPA: PspC domain-containing protein [Methanocorpusculum sp.]|nr:PspC domain-containing protein [Methanocorpusculum sp.]
MTKKFMRSSTDRLLGGVCGGIAEYFSIPAWLVRILWVIVTIFTLGFIGVLIYILMWFFVPKNLSRKKIDPNCIDADFEVKE